MPQSENFTWKNDAVIKEVFLAGAIYFLITTVYSLFHYQEKFFLDGYSLIFYITNWQWFPPPAQREVVYLQQILPVLATIVGLKIKWVMIAYILNVYLLYFLLFTSMVVMLKDPLSGIFLLLLHYKGDPYNYFMMVEELLPGCCMAIMLISVFRNAALINNKYVFYVIVVFLLFFIVRSHPLSIVCLSGGLVLLFFTNRELFVYKRKDLLIVALVAVSLLGIKILLLNPYDSTYIKSHKGFVQSALQLIQPDYFSEMVFYLFYARKVFTLTFSVILIYLFLKKKYVNIIIFILLVSATVILFNTQVIVTDFKLHTINFLNYDRWSLPVRFIVFATFCYMILAEVQSLFAFRAIKLGFNFYFLLGFIQVTEAHEESISYIKQANRIIEKCRKNGVSKAAIKLDELDGSIPLHYRCYEDIMVLSALNNPDSCIQVVYINDDVISQIKQSTPEDILLHEGERLYCIEEEINSHYYRLREEPYSIVRMEE